MSENVTKTAVVTGASRGIGKQVTLVLADRGYKVFIAARDKKALESVQKDIQKQGGEAEIVILDLLQPESIISAAELIMQKTGHVDVLANIAGMYHDDERHFFDIPFEDYPDHAIIQNINASLVGHVLLTKHLVPIMKPGSCVLNTSGTFGDGETGVISDFLAKKGVELFSQQLALELKEKTIRSNCVRLGFVFTENVQKFFPQTTKDEALDPKKVAKQIVDLAEDPQLNGKIVEITV